MLKRLVARMRGRTPAFSENIVLHAHRAIYLPIPKVASTSLKKICSDLLGLADPDPENPHHHVHKRPYPSVPGHLLRTTYADYFKFAFVRNPWDRLVSCYHNKIRSDPDFSDAAMGFENGVATTFSRYGNLFWGGMDFEDFCHAICAIPDGEADSHFISQHTFLADAKGEPVVDFVGRYENLKDDFARVCETIGLAGVTLGHLMKSEHRHYATRYPERCIETVGRRYARDVEMFGYRFC